MFPFATYLSAKLDVPRSAIEVQHLVGGLTNYTCRVTFRPPVSLPPSALPAEAHRQGCCYESIICKYAPPFVAGLGPDQPMSSVRQDIEARALRLFHRDGVARPLLVDEKRTPTNTVQNLGPGSLAALLDQHSAIHIPKLLYHDTEEHVLLMTDLGTWPTLANFLEPPLRATEDKIIAVASTLGAFLAALHRMTATLPRHSLDPFHNTDAERVVYETAGALPRRLLRAAGVPDADQLGTRAERHMSPMDDGAGLGGPEPCFGMADLWVGNVLVGGDDSVCKVGLVDWEYAGRSSAGSEMGFLTAHLCVPLHDPAIISSNSSSSNRITFISTLLSAYRLRYGPPSPACIWRTLVAHGQELINAVDFTGAVLGDQAAHRDALIKAGARFLRAAGEAESGTDIDLTHLAKWEKEVMGDLLDGGLST